MCLPNCTVLQSTTHQCHLVSRLLQSTIYYICCLFCAHNQVCQPPAPSIDVDTHSHTHKPLSVLAEYLYNRVVGRHRIPSAVPMDLADCAGSVHDVTGPESSVKAIRGAESRAPNLGIVDLLDRASPSAVTDRQTVTWRSGVLMSTY
jgi:hypothetical protein